MLFPPPRLRASLHLHDARLAELEDIAQDLRVDVVEMLVQAGSGHSAGPLGMAEIFTAFYFHILTHRPEEPEWKDRDRLILSNGHIVPIRYAAMARAGYFPKKFLKTLRVMGSPLQGHPERMWMPGVETTSGPLGSGSSQAAGMAYHALRVGAPWRVFCVMSDGELQCGQTWEAFLFASRNGLGNCTFVVDRNQIQIDGRTEDIMPLEPLIEKCESFGLHVESCAGNNVRDVVGAVQRAQAISDRPTLILANTIPGYGVHFMENRFEWHGKPPKPGAETRAALRDLRSLGGRIEGDHT